MGSRSAGSLIRANQPRVVVKTASKEFQATVENDKVKNFRVNVKVSFVLEEDRKK
jgi:flavin-binding protein dodecin